MMNREELRALIIAKFKTARRFSGKVGLTESMVSYILSGKKKLSPWNADNFAKVLGIDRQLLDGMVSEHVRESDKHIL